VFVKGSLVSVCLQKMHSLSALNDSTHAIIIATKAVTSGSKKGCILCSRNQT